MLTLRYARQSRLSLTPLFYSTATTSAADLVTQSFHTFSFHPTPSSSSSLSPQSNSKEALQTKDIILPFKDWFITRKNPLFDRIFEILGTQEGIDSFEALRSLNLSLNEKIVLDVLNYGKTHKGVFYCVRFFDWAGRQREFSHTAATFHAMFKIFYKAKLSSVIHDFLENYTKERYTLQPVRFYDTLVIGYSVAGKPEIALQAFGKMRFQGTDMNSFAYHVLLNSLVEEGYFDVVPVIESQIRIRGLENEITHSIIMKNFCKKKDLNGAEEYLRSLMTNSHGDGNRKVVGFSSVLVGILVDALCRAKQFEKAGALMDEMKKVDVDSMDYAYDVWARNLIQARKLDCSLEFYRSRMKTDGYTPGIYTYNSLVCRLLRENRLREVFDLLIEMKEQKILPDEVTMNATLCFFCKAGMLDAALKLYESRSEFGLSVNSKAHNCLINTLFSDTSIDDAFRMLKSAIGQGYFPGEKTFSVISDALCRERKLDEMKELILAALDRDFKPSYLTYEKFIIAFCRSNRVQDGYKLLRELNRNTDTTRSTYFTLISSFYRAGRGDIAAWILIEMQEKGHKPTRQLIRAVICRLCSMNEEEDQRQFFRLLELQLTRFKPSRDIYNFFIDGAGHAKKPHLARQVYQMMTEAGILPDSQSDKLLLQSFICNGWFNDALLFFENISKSRKINRRLWHIMIVGLCRGYKPELALDMFWKMTKHRVPSIQCYEELVRLMCTCRKYSMTFTIIDHLVLVGRPISTFIGNMLLLHSLYSQELYYVCKSNNFNNLTPHRITLAELIGAFTDSIRGDEDVEELEVIIQRCFPLDLYTCNLLLRKIMMTDIDHGREFFNGLHEKGYEPNRWSYDILIYGLLKNGRSTEAGLLAEEFFGKGLDVSESTRRLM